MDAHVSKDKPFVVLVGAYNQAVPAFYFDKLKGAKPFVEADENIVFRYYLGGYATKAEADAARDAAAQVGFAFARTIDMMDQKSRCGQGCTPQNSYSSAIAPLVMRLKTIQALFFDFNSSTLRPASHEQLTRLKNVLKDYPTYNAELLAHTDAVGSDEYNDALSIRRAESAKQYLIAHGIPESRIKVATFGKKAPIARNEFADGRDAPEGRQFNRRVEIKILDTTGSILTNMIEDIKVPENLKL